MRSLKANGRGEFKVEVHYSIDVFPRRVKNGKLPHIAQSRSNDVAKPCDSEGDLRFATLDKHVRI